MTQSGPNAGPEPEDAGAVRIYVVDRREGATIVMIGDDDRSVDVDAARLPRTCRAEGAVLRVPLGKNGIPVWEDARRDRAEERRRIAEIAKRVKRLRQSDPGGDIVL